MEVGRLPCDGGDDRLEAVVVGEGRVGDGRVEHVGLGQQRDGAVVVAAGAGEGVMDLLDGRGGTAQDLGGLLRRGCGVAGPGREAVVTADDVDRGERDAGALPADVLRDALVRLGLDPGGVLAEGRAGVGEEQFTQRAQALEWVVAAVVGPMAVGPFVVADGVDERVVEGVEPSA